MLTLRRLETLSSQQEYVVRMDGFAGLNMRDDDSIMALEESPKAENVITEGGRLKRAMGFDAVKWKKDSGQEVMLRQLPEEIIRLFEFQAASSETEGYKNLYYTATDGNLYRFIYNEQLSKVEAEPVSCTDGITGWEYTYFTQYKSGKNNCALLGGPNCGPYIYTEDGSYTLVSSQTRPHMEKTAMHFSRMFGIGDPEYPQRIWFSKIGDPGDFTASEEAGGYIDITDTIGSAIDIVSFFDTLLVFCRYGIVAVNTLSVQSDFTVENIFFSDSEIIRGSVTVCGDCVLFATRYGVYSCNGSGVSCISNALKGFFDKNTILCRKECSIYFKNCYYLTFHRKTPQEESGLLIYNIVYRQWQIYTGPEIISMVVCRDRNTEKLLTAFSETTVVMEWGVGENMATSGAIQGFWYSPKNDLGLAHAWKTIKEVHFSAWGDGPIQITVFADEKEQSKTVILSGQERHYKLPFSLKGHLIGFLIKNTAGSFFSVSPFTFLYTAERDFVS